MILSRLRKFRTYLAVLANHENKMEFPDFLAVPFSGPDVTTLGGMFADTIDNKTNILPSFPLLSEPKNPKIREMRCPEKCDAFCECLNLIKVELNSVIEIVLIDSRFYNLLKLFAKR